MPALATRVLSPTPQPPISHSTQATESRGRGPGPEMAKLNPRNGETAKFSNYGISHRTSTKTGRNRSFYVEAGCLGSHSSALFDPYLARRLKKNPTWRCLHKIASEMIISCPRLKIGYWVGSRRCTQQRKCRRHDCCGVCGSPFLALKMIKHDKS